MNAHNLIKDTAKRMDVSEDDIFTCAAYDPDNEHLAEVEEAVRRYHNHGQIPDWVEDFCLDVMCDKIPLLPLKAHRRP